MEEITVEKRRRTRSKPKVRDQAVLREIANRVKVSFNPEKPRNPRCGTRVQLSWTSDELQAGLREVFNVVAIFDKIDEIEITPEGITAIIVGRDLWSDFEFTATFPKSKAGTRNAEEMEKKLAHEVKKLGGELVLRSVGEDL
jgi:hypothetical protein